MRLLVCLLALYPALLCSCASVDAAQKPDPKQPLAVQAQIPNDGSSGASVMNTPPAVLPAPDALVLKPLWKKGDIQKFWIVQNLKVTNGATVLLDSEKSETGIFTVLDTPAKGYQIQWLDSEIQQVRGAKNPLEGKIANTLENTKIQFSADEQGQFTSLDNYPVLKTTAEENLKRLAAIIGTNARVKTLMDQYRERMATPETAFDMLAQSARSIFALMGTKVNPQGATQVGAILSKAHSGSLVPSQGVLEVKSYDKGTGEMVVDLTQALDSTKAADWMIETLAEVAKTSKTAAPDAQAIKSNFSYTDKATYSLNFKTGKVSKVTLERIMKSGVYTQREYFQADLLKK